MTYTYDLSTAIGQVRLLVPDNVETGAALTDEEIQYFLNQTGQSVNRATIKACQQLARKFSQQMAFTADGLSIHATERAQAYATRAKELMAELGGSYGTITINRSDGYADHADEDEYSA
jgi:hypothetical protein